MAHGSATTDLPGPRPAGQPFLPATRRGFTLAEGLMACTVLAISVAAVVSPISASYQQSRASQQISVASTLARQLLDEIVAKPFVDPTDYTAGLGPSTGETNRAQFDNIGDYYNYSDTTSSLKLADGTVIGPLDGGVYQRSVRVEYRATPSGRARASGDFAAVTVTVTAPNGQSVSLWRLVPKLPLLVGTGADR